MIIFTDSKRKIDSQLHQQTQLHKRHISRPDTGLQSSGRCEYGNRLKNPANRASKNVRNHGISQRCGPNPVRIPTPG